MGQSYLIFGRQVPSHQIVVATLAALGGAIFYSTSGSKAAPAPVTAPSAAQAADSFDVEKSIVDFLKEQDSKK
ncbi:hypothetical protein NADFUDRAFT_52978 [Nadsonia fulvescens var. elongata DSM 6958]|uniref:ATP synthase subunit K, mitochondrial n=1 Tax=Nadsonia fulvescens var. elongata DSM 6958 TaxID=857566 RepID=A0A1E3PF08_9ASCO|nr:hypothetical protein NADFUDRAFT_52978 [Nadsonia fulvescens var. elongata DSM 6958]